MRPTLIVSCEHGGNRIPTQYGDLFAGSRELLNSHRGFDAGALHVARRLSKILRAPLFAATVSRLLVDLNRSMGHPALFSPVTQGLSTRVRQAILKDHYLPHRGAVEQAVKNAVGKRAVVLHLCVHSFTPVLHGDVRRADVGLLYDPRRPGEKAFCQAWQNEARRLQPNLRVRRNYPYRGAADGFTTHLRRRWPAQRYIGIELEMNQAFVAAGGAAWRDFQRTLETCFVSTLKTFSSP